MEVPMSPKLRQMQLVKTGGRPLIVKDDVEKCNDRDRDEIEIHKKLDKMPHNYDECDGECHIELPSYYAWFSSTLSAIWIPKRECGEMIAKDWNFSDKGSLERSKWHMNGGGLGFCSGEDGEHDHVENSIIVLFEWANSKFKSQVLYRTSTTMLESE
ncbi:hypothetical protein JHK84_043890 [Glycine max]|nr:hypothetical protein JHK84_043890 [Glycine max]